MIDIDHQRGPMPIEPCSNASVGVGRRRVDMPNLMVYVASLE